VDTGGVLAGAGSGLLVRKTEGGSVVPPIGLSGKGDIIRSSHIFLSIPSVLMYVLLLFCPFLSHCLSSTNLTLSLGNRMLIGVESKLLGGFCEGVLVDAALHPTWVIIGHWSLLVINGH
jgi:hypothetical protein